MTTKALKTNPPASHAKAKPARKNAKAPTPPITEDAKAETTPKAQAPAQTQPATKTSPNGPALATQKAETKLQALTRLMSRPDGASVVELAEATGWQKHSVRGAIAGSLKKALGLTITTQKEAERGTVYRISEAAETEVEADAQTAEAVIEAAA